MPQEKGNTTSNALGRFTGTKGLTEQQAAFVREYCVNGHSQTEAARRAGYSAAGNAGYMLMKNPRIAAAIHEAVQRVIKGDLARQAIRVIQVILEDDDAPQKVRLDAAKTILDRAGHIAPKAQDAGQEGKKDIEDMSIAELQTFIEDAKRRAADAASPVIDAETMRQDAPQSADPSAQVIDIEEEGDA